MTDIAHFIIGNVISLGLLYFYHIVITKRRYQKDNKDWEDWLNNKL